MKVIDEMPSNVPVINPYTPLHVRTVNVYSFSGSGGGTGGPPKPPKAPVKKKKKK